MNTRVQIIVTTHAISLWNEAKLKQGHCDIPLSRAGMVMAELMAGRDDLRMIREIHTSDLCRAIDTARPLADRLGIPISQHQELREGRWKEMHVDRAFPPLPFSCESESYDQLLQRAIGIMKRIAEDAIGSPVLIVTHGSFLRQFLAHIDPSTKGNYQGIRTALNRLIFYQDIWTVLSLNDNAHLSGFDPLKVSIDNG